MSKPKVSNEIFGGTLQEIFPGILRDGLPYSNSFGMVISLLKSNLNEEYDQVKSVSIIVIESSRLVVGLKQISIITKP